MWVCDCVSACARARACECVLWYECVCVCVGDVCGWVDVEKRDPRSDPPDDAECEGGLLDDSPAVVMDECVSTAVAMLDAMHDAMLGCDCSCMVEGRRVGCARCLRCVRW